ncbi:L-aspartate oxidase [bacterium]|nr:L-aspartate oxidase [bacterium]MBU1982839.1 L-aspartate oxidase [bacterium]
MSRRRTDILIIGSGIAGLSLALKASRYADVLLATKKDSVDTATNWAQGGIAAVTAGDDDFRLHLEDTLRVGAGLCRPEAVQLVVESAPARIRELMELGVRFTRHEGELALAREGGHSRARILHHHDHTGQEIESVLLQKARESGRLELLEHHLMIDLLMEPRSRMAFEAGRVPRCFGAYILDVQNDLVEAVEAKAVVLCTGGSGMAYYHTTNPSIATADGVVAAWRAGAVVGNLEFFQFHPTTLYEPDTGSQSRALITEALRGFGAKLRTRTGESFMHLYDERKELAPRDVVARAIDAELKKRGEPYVVLDCTHLSVQRLREEFPYVDQICHQRGIDFTRDPIPVVPAAHYQCGGVVTDLEARTSLPGLFAVGEVAMTGVHGANRLASNSLLEAVVFADRAAESCKKWLREAAPLPEAEEWSAEGTVNQEEWVLVEHNRDEIRKIMWDYVGIVRSTLRLERAQRRMQLLRKEIEDFFRRTRVNGPLVELRNLVVMADLIVQSAISRRESRGLHFMTDYPDLDRKSGPEDTILSRYHSSAPASGRHGPR